MGSVPEDGVTHVVVVGALNMVEEHTILILTGVPQNAAPPDDDIPPDIDSGS
jgi:hypothetical protein